MVKREFNEVTTALLRLISSIKSRAKGLNRRGRLAVSITLIGILLSAVFASVHLVRLAPECRVTIWNSAERIEVVSQEWHECSFEEGLDADRPHTSPNFLDPADGEKITYSRGGRLDYSEVFRWFAVGLLITGSAIGALFARWWIADAER